jgi:hypothetical protein
MCLCDVPPCICMCYKLVTVVDIRKVAVKQCNDIVKCVLEFLISLDEDKELECQIQSQAGQLVAAVSLLHAFCNANPNLLVDHVDILYPYLKGLNNLSSEDERLVSLSICGIIKQVSGST